MKKKKLPWLNQVIDLRQNIINAILLLIPESKSIRLISEEDEEERDKVFMELSIVSSVDKHSNYDEYCIVEVSKDQFNNLTFHGVDRTGEATSYNKEFNTEDLNVGELADIADTIEENKNGN